MKIKLIKLKIKTTPLVHWVGIHKRDQAQVEPVQATTSFPTRSEKMCKSTYIICLMVTIVLKADLDAIEVCICNFKVCHILL